MIEKMVQGTLSVNLEPPYIGLKAEHAREIRRSCTVEEIKKILLALKIITPQQHWPPKDCVMRLPGQFPGAVLARFGLLPITFIKSNWQGHSQELAYAENSFSS